MALLRKLRYIGMAAHNHVIAFNKQLPLQHIYIYIHPSIIYTPLIPGQGHRGVLEPIILGERQEYTVDWPPIYHRAYLYLDIHNIQWPCFHHFSAVLPCHAFYLNSGVIFNEI